MFKFPTEPLPKFMQHAQIVYQLSKRDFQNHYHGSYLGFAWSLLLPLIFLFVLYLVFSLGLKVDSLSYDMPFTLYLLTGMICWNYYSSGLNAMTGVIEGHSYLVKEVGFPLSLLPSIPLFGGLLPHLFQLVIAMAFAIYEGYAPTLYAFQVLYYLLAMQALLLGMGWLISATILFAKDVAKVVEIFVQFSFWLTPIFWNISLLPEAYQWLLQLNPMYYVVSGYRDSLVLGVGFWERPGQALYFWLFVGFFIILGFKVFKKLRPHLAEVVL